MALPVSEISNTGTDMVDKTSSNPSYQDGSRSNETTFGVILAGGLSRRMGGEDKSRLQANGQTLLEHIIARAAPQVDRLLINSNLSTAAGIGEYTVIPDEHPGFPGPLAGIVAALRWCRKQRQPLTWLATFATDTPFVPLDFVQKCLAQATQKGTTAAYACHGTQQHYAMGLWHLSILPRLEARLAAGEFALKGALAEAEAVNFANAPEAPQQDPFFNINTPDDWLLAQRFLEDAKK